MASTKKTKPKVATIGAATQDVFLMGNALKAKRDVRTHEFVEQFPLGAKLELDRVVFSTGGGATNAAVTFTRQGFATQFLGKIGDDPAGQSVVKELKAEGINTATLICDVSGSTGYSTLLLAPRGERTVLVHRGVSQELSAEDFSYFAKLKADWLYVTSLAGNFPLLESAIEYAKTHGIKLAINPGSSELKQPERLQKLLHNFSIVSVNKEESELLADGKTINSRVRQLAQQCAVAVITDGAKGSYACDGAAVYKAGMYEDVPVLDRTGAGDAFTSGFVAKVMEGESIEKALTFGSANSTSVVQSVGSKTGILSSDAKLRQMEIKKTTINTKE